MTSSPILMYAPFGCKFVALALEKKGAPVMESTKYVGLDVHKEATTIAVMNSAGKLIMESIVETKAITIRRFGEATKRHKTLIKSHLFHSRRRPKKLGERPSRLSVEYLPERSPTPMCTLMLSQWVARRYCR